MVETTQDEFQELSRPLLNNDQNQPKPGSLNVEAIELQETKESFAESNLQKVPKMSNFRTFFAIVKAYMAINILLTPRSFVNGGFILSPVALVIATSFESLCSVRLANVAYETQVFSYPLLMEKAIGRKGLIISHIFLAIAHWQFTVGQTTFALESMQSTIAAWQPGSNEVPLWVFGILICVVYSPIVWVRKLAYFSKGYIVAICMILIAVATTSYYAIDLITEQDDGPGPDYEAINHDSFWSMVGYAFYMFEGIGCLLPIMRESEHPENFAWLTLGAQWSICIAQILFASLCYYAWGSDIVEPIVTELLPAENTFVQVMKLLYCVNLVYSYRMNIVPTFSCLEVHLLGIRETEKDEDDQDQMEGEGTNSQRTDSRQLQDTATYWKVNAMRSLVVVLTVIVVLIVAKSLDKFYAISGAVLGMTNVVLLPAICHQRLIAKSTCEKGFNVSLMTLACFLMVFLPAIIVSQW